MAVRPIRPRPNPQSAGLVTESILDSWDIAMSAERKSPRTRQIYLTQVRRFSEWATACGLDPVLTRDNVRAFLAAENERGLEATTLVTRFKGLQQFARWLTEEGEVDANPMSGMKPPRAADKPVPYLADDELRAMLAACKGSHFRDRRDLAALWLLIDTGARASEVVGMTLGDVDLKRELALLHGKGGTQRQVHLGPDCRAAIDRYLRARRTHPYADLQRLWLGQRGAITYEGLSEALQARARSAGVEGFHLHRLRHTLAHNWLAAGGSETSLMTVTGWRSREMLGRYGASGKAQRAQDEHRRLGLGERLR